MVAPRYAALGPLVMYSLLVLVASYRLYVHRLRRCEFKAMTAKWAFHFVLLLFAVARLASAVWFVAPWKSDVADLVLDVVSVCFNFSVRGPERDLAARLIVPSHCPVISHE